MLWKSTANGDYVDDEFVKDILFAHGTTTGTARGKVTFIGYGIDATSQIYSCDNLPFDIFAIVRQYVDNVPGYPRGPSLYVNMPIPAWCGCKPVIKQARDGAHLGQL